MGIKHFFIWFKNNFSENMYKLKNEQKFSDIDVSIDNLMIDANGIFHNSAQKIYEYGSFKPPPRLLKKSSKKIYNHYNLQIKLFKDVCKTIENIVNIVNPKKRIIICVDGPAPISKQNQQRQRRFKSVLEPNKIFDSNCITPGTKFMHFLTKYIDWFIKDKITSDPKWKNIDVIFSNEKAPGEGEHKIINFIRNFGKIEESYCIHGLDADLIMLALGTHMPKFFILREDLYDASNDYFCINIGKTHNGLINKLYWKSDDFIFDPEYAVNDFIFLCFIVGNDFLPHIPSIEIIESGIELIIEVYKEITSSYGHITEKKGNDVYFVPKTLEIFLGTIGQHEKENLEKKLNKKRNFFQDILLEKNSKQNKQKWEVNIEKYIQEYNNSKFPLDKNIEKICHEYLEGMQWVLSYYTKGVPNWKWHYKYHYAPTASTLALYFKNFKFPIYKKTIPSTPFQQLLCVLPPKSSKLIPKPLCNLLTDDNSLLKQYCPDNIEIDLSGKRKEWEGIVLLPIVDFNLVKDCYFKLINQVNQHDIKLNISGHSFLYKYNDFAYNFNSHYGNIPFCKVKIKILDL